jgi:exodeoxyribonuclease V gamma subunit
LKLWLHHLALNAMELDDITRQSYWVGEDQLVTLEPVEQPETLLRGLLEWYWQGSQGLLHFFPKSGLAYIQQLHKDKEPNPDKALWAARRVWEGEERRPGTAERENAYYQLAFGDSDPLDEKFTTLAMAVFGPLFAQIPRDELSKS